MLRREARRDAPRREGLGVQKHAAGQMRHLQDVGQRVNGALAIGPKLPRLSSTLPEGTLGQVRSCAL
jgi:hypothetical protein